ncbi:MAG: Spx/MgsR family RNA polymerase-binding regulatory protein [Gemmatimonadaceae bacterium]
MKKKSAVRLYGFKTCDMVRNALKWLDANGIAHDFFDYRKEVLDPKVVDDWFTRAGWENVFNRNSTAFKELPESDKADINAKRAKQLILAETNLIKRPVLDAGDELLLGFKADVWAQALGVSAKSP